MKRLFNLVISLAVLSLLAWAAYYSYFKFIPPQITTQTSQAISRAINSNSDATPPPIPVSKFIPNDYHIFQTFNNCGPASLSMALSYYGINASQAELGQALRPYQHPTGDNDDKSTTLVEMAYEAESRGLVAYHRPAGDFDLIKRFIAADIPVVARTWLHEGEDIGHYRVIKGYDDLAQVIIQDDSYQGKNLKYSYSDFESLWQAFNYEYLVLVSQNKQDLAESILGPNIDENYAWQKAIEISQTQLNIDPNDVFARFNLSVAYYYLGQYQDSVREFELVENKLSFRMLWYQIEPILSYARLGNYARVFSISDDILTHGNRAFSELYDLRGQIYLKQGNQEAAEAEFAKARLYNRNYQLGSTSFY